MSGLTTTTESELRAAASAYWLHPSRETFARWRAAAKAAIDRGEVGK